MKLIRLFCLPLLALALSLTACHDSDDSHHSEGVGNVTCGTQNVTIGNAYYSCSAADNSWGTDRYTFVMKGDGDFSLTIMLGGELKAKTVDAADALYIQHTHGKGYNYSEVPYYGAGLSMPSSTGKITISPEADGKVRITFDLTLTDGKKLKGSALVAKEMNRVTVGNDVFGMDDVAITSALYYHNAAGSAWPADRYAFKLTGMGGFDLTIFLDGDLSAKTIDVSDALLVQYDSYDYYPGESYMGSIEHPFYCIGEISIRPYEGKILIEFDLSLNTNLVGMLHTKMKGSALVSKGSNEPSGIWTVKQAGIDPETGEEIYVTKD